MVLLHEWYESFYLVLKYKNEETQAVYVNCNQHEATSCFITE